MLSKFATTCVVRLYLIRLMVCAYACSQLGKALKMILDTVCGITFEKWVDTLSGHNEVSMDIRR